LWKKYTQDYYSLLSAM